MISSRRLGGSERVSGCLGSDKGLKQRINPKSPAKIVGNRCVDQMNRAALLQRILDNPSSCSHNADISQLGQ